MVGLDHGRSVFIDRRPYTWEILLSIRHQLLGGEYSNDAFCCARHPRVNRIDPGVRDGRAANNEMRLVRKSGVGRVTAVTGDEAPVFFAPDGFSDPVQHEFLLCINYKLAGNPAATIPSMGTRLWVILYLGIYNITPVLNMTMKRGPHVQ